MSHCFRAVFFASLAMGVNAQTAGNFSLSLDNAAISVPAGASATLTLNVNAASGYTQPIYLMPGGLPEGISLLIPSPVVGSQAVRAEIRAAAGVRQQMYKVAVYAAGGGQNFTIHFSVTVLPEGMPTAAPDTATAPAADNPVVELPEAPPPPLGTHWVGSWGASAVTPSHDSGAYYLTNVTVRQISHLTIGTRTGIRLRLSNALGKDAVSFGAVHVAKLLSDSAIVSDTDRVVTFSGLETLTIPAGAEVLSDPIPMPLPAGADLAISLYIPRSSNVPATMHTFGNQASYFSLGNAVSSTTMPNAATDKVRPYLTGVDVDAPEMNAVVVLGDSLTDGTRWADDLAGRLHSLSVVNEGIAGNCIVMNCMGPNIPDRIQRDVLGISGARFLIVQAGANDIGNVPDLTLAQISDAYKSIVAQAHAQGITVYGATIPPFGGSNYFTTAHEKLRQQLNAFIRSAGAFDGVIDFDKTLADPENPAYLYAVFNGDKIHPNDAGYRALADGIDLGLFSVR